MVSVDIRPLPVMLPDLTVMEGTVLRLPFSDRSVLSLSSLCVLEHIGLGRYGDPLDPLGTEHATVELCRVLAPGGSLYVSVPIEGTSRTYFNAHRVFSPDEFVASFVGLKLVESRFVQKSGLQPRTDLDLSRAETELTIGLFHLRSPTD